MMSDDLFKVPKKAVNQPQPTQPTEKKTLSPAQQTRLWETYGIRHTEPVRQKVEVLFSYYRLKAEEIALELCLSIEEVTQELGRLKAEWESLGKALTAEEKAIARGQMISQLMRLQRELEGHATSDPKIISLRYQILTRIEKLKEIEPDKKDTSSSETDEDDQLDELFSNLDNEEIANLYKRLTTSNQ